MESVKKLIIIRNSNLPVDARVKLTNLDTGEQRVISKASEQICIKEKDGD